MLTPRAAKKLMFEAVPPELWLEILRELDAAECVAAIAAEIRRMHTPWPLREKKPKRTPRSLLAVARVSKAFLPICTELIYGTLTLRGRQSAKSVLAMLVNRVGGTVTKVDGGLVRELRVACQLDEELDELLLSATESMQRLLRLDVGHGGAKILFPVRTFPALVSLNCHLSTTGGPRALAAFLHRHPTLQQFSCPVSMRTDVDEHWASDRDAVAPGSIPMPALRSFDGHPSWLTRFKPPTTEAPARLSRVTLSWHSGGVNAVSALRGMTAEVGLHCELWIAGDDRLEAVMDAVADAVPHVSVLWLLVRCPFTDLRLERFTGLTRLSVMQEDTDRAGDRAVVEAWGASCRTLQVCEWHDRPWTRADGRWVENNEITCAFR
ncbi:hypothetical protein B0H14DRAFT_3870275 [Mycena olivaceomarginata]|nr:hypothetical protein B0H14DRAFT_3870275 [Mycena olivaceomarginata]